MASMQYENCISPYRRLLIDMSMELSRKDLERLMFALGDRLPRRVTENIDNGLKLFEALEQDVHIGPQDLALLHDGFQAIGRMDLAQRIQLFPRKLHRADETDDGKDDIVTDGVGDGSDPEPKESYLAYTGARTGSSSESVRPSSAPSQTLTPESSARLQRDSAVGLAPARYVNFLFYEGYSVAILGGKHYKTPDGEFVEMKSGTQYKIHVINTYAYGCHLDIFIDGYDVGRWALHGGEEVSIERSAYEAKRFTFYRAKTAPKEAGIESGRAENGLIKCVFTPEAYLNIPVIISDSSQPWNVNMPLSATAGDLKREVQHQMGVMHDPYQVLALGDKVQLSNDTRLRSILRKPGDLRLIIEDITITVTAEPSSSLPFQIKVHPGKATVHSLMEQIERELQIPVRDQKLYYERKLLSAAPSSFLPAKLICSPRPAVSVIIPEYIHITVEYQGGDSILLKINKEKNLRAVMEEIPSCSNLQENNDAKFFFNGIQLCPFKDNGTLASLGICSGSKLELTVRIPNIEVKVCFSDNSLSFRVKCNPQDTFQDLVEKILIGHNSSKCRITFAMNGREFDPDQDKGPLRDYGVSQDCSLRVMRHPATPTNDDSTTAFRDKNVFRKCDSITPVQAHRTRSILDLVGGRPPLYKGLSPNVVERDPAWRAGATTLQGHSTLQFDAAEPIKVYPLRTKLQLKFQSHGLSVVETDPAWRAGATTLQGHSAQQFITAEPIQVDPSRKVELVLRLVARDGEEHLEFPKGDCKPLSTLTPPAVQE